MSFSIPEATFDFNRSFIESENSKIANQLLDKKYPDMKDDYHSKFSFLKKYFTFSLAERYTSAKGDDLDREDYWSTLYYLIREARISGAEAVIIKK